MNREILDKEVQEYIFKTSATTFDINKVILAGSPFANISIQEIAQQLVGRQKAISKLPTWSKTEGIYYPPKLNLEQTSSETTAIYKSNLVSGNTLIDLTGGFGIDDYFFSKKIDQIIHCERNEELSKIAAHNFKTLKINNIETYADDGFIKLKELEYIDWIYVDPSRRHDQKGKVFFLEDCEPNIPLHLDFLFSKASNILIKTSPLLDIHTGIKTLKKVKQIHVVAINNEVKELLWILDKNSTQKCSIHTINLRKDGDQKFSFIMQHEFEVSSMYALPKKYLYEPNAAILKSGGFSSIGIAYSMDKLHQHSHLYTSDDFIDFPGRKFEIISSIPFNKKAIKNLQLSKANITTRNFPENVATIRKKFKIKDGGDDYLFFTTDLENNKIVICCKKV